MATPATTTASGAAGGVFPPFDSSTFASQLFWLALSFGVLYWLMATVIVPRIGGILADRAGRISGDLDKAAEMKAKAEEAGLAYEKALAEARAKSQAIAQQTREEANTASDKRRKSLEADLAAKLAKAEEQIAATKAKAMANVDGIAADAAAAIVQQLSGVAPTKAVVAEAVKTVTKA